MYNSMYNYIFSMYKLLFKSWQAYFSLYIYIFDMFEYITHTHTKKNLNTVQETNVFARRRAYFKLFWPNVYMLCQLLVHAFHTNCCAYIIKLMQ